MKTTTIKISDEQHDFLSKNFSNVSEGVRQCVDSIRFPSENDTEYLKMIRLHSKKELMGKFTKDEWLFFFDSLNGTLTDARYRCNPDILAFHSEDSEAFDGTATKWGLNIKDLIVKIKNLTAAQVEALYCYVEDFWNSPDESRNLEEWASRML